jgi:hypothetical protein
LIFLLLIFLEFVTLTFGVSLLFSRVNAFQIVLHFVGCAGTVWQILNLNQFKTMWTLCCFFGLLPFLLELSVLLLAATRYRVIDQVEAIQRNMEAKARERYQERLRIESEKLAKMVEAKKNAPPTHKTK